MFTEYSINGYWFILFLTLLVIGHLLYEIFSHRRRLSQIKHRIHVNGTRGKSSVARLIAAGLRGGGVKTVCKTTGTMARFIAPNGREEPVIRIGRTNVIEQVHVVKKAVKFHPEALVIECMAVQPLLQSLCELKLVRSTIGVLCNAKADHLDVMGPTEHDVALALAATMPVQGTFITPEKKYLSVFVSAAKDRDSNLLEVSDNDIVAITDEEMERFSYLEYKVNVALALKVCEFVGVSRDNALKGMWSAKPDPGALILKTISYKDKKITLANGFAANDPISTKQLWEKVVIYETQATDIIGLVNCRNDRGDRSRQMAEIIHEFKDIHQVLVIGSGCDAFTKSINHKENMVIQDGEGYDVNEVLEFLYQQSQGNQVLAIGVCNIAAIGFALLNHFLAENNE